MIERSRHLIADGVDPGAIVAEQHVIVAVASRQLGPQRLAVGSKQPDQQILTDWPGGPSSRIDGRAPPAIRRKSDFPAVRASGRVEGWPEQRGVRILRRDERQRAVIEDDVNKQHADAMNDPACIALAERAASVKQHFLFGGRERFAEYVPRAACFDRPIRRQELGRQVQGKPADQPSGR